MWTGMRCELIFATMCAIGMCVKLNDIGGGNLDYYQENTQAVTGGSQVTGVTGGGDSLTHSIPGTPGQDYPAFSNPPRTGFSCRNQQFPGYYADDSPEVGCQVFHICEQDGRMHSFLCPIGTVFNQRVFVCDWWYNVDCSLSGQFYQLNALLGRVGATLEGGNTGGNFGTTGGTNDGGSGFQPPPDGYQTAGK